ncbi:hypothetical protein LTR37_008006 [Vermiconidia calcicola]|uniref:Uncharacterized protein n=1 Tax=Vermiconidia calcicola TaxID=1690605 RepID=A0ACC3NC23_9PEZI|nr:hypothetical protein LTR37_008006 [Vermiconidia calcicola]
MERLPRLSEASEESASTEGSVVNFSRPRLYSNLSHNRVKHDHSGTPNGYGNTRAINAFHDANRHLPAEPRFSQESERTATDRSENSASSEFAWDGEAGELKTRIRPRRFEEQRYERAPRSRESVTASGSSSSPRAPLLRPQFTNNSGSSKTSTQRNLAAVDQRSVRTSTSTSTYEDTRSHHTVSDDGDDQSGFYDDDGNWQSSSYDTSGLSEAQIRKLQKKGINPSLYAEMKAAKKGKSKWVGPLLGNSFLG